jgi:uncharacterized protein (TIGR03435 family)
MNKVLWVLALAICPGSALLAQSFPGTWQGVIKVPQAPNGELRIVLRISTTAANKLAADFYSIDQRTPAIPATSITAIGNTLKVTIERVNGSYECRMSADGKMINGTRTQQGGPAPLDLTRAAPETAWTIPEPPPPPKMMDPNAKPEFEVATIKPSDPNRPGRGITVNPSGIFHTLNTTLNDLIKFAYGVHPKQVVSAPAWADSERFDIEAKPDRPGMPTVNQMKVMVQKLLADRFSLTYHNDKRELSAYAITVPKSGLKIKKEESAIIPIPGFGGLPQRGFNARNATLAEFASVMQAQFTDLPVIDQAELGDTRYTFILKFTPDPNAAFRRRGSPASGAIPDATCYGRSRRPAGSVQRHGAAIGIAYAKNQGAGGSDDHRQSREAICELRRLELSYRATMPRAPEHLAPSQFHGRHPSRGAGAEPFHVGSRRVAQRCRLQEGPPDPFAPPAPDPASPLGP